MFRSLIFWEICRRIDDGTPIGPWLIWIAGHDRKTADFLRKLQGLEHRLCSDAARITEERKRTPLRVASRFTDRKTVGRKNVVAATTLAITLIGVSALLWGTFFGDAFHTVYAVSAEPNSASPTSVVQSDPQVFEELVQLCRTSPNEIGPFFNSPNR